MLTVVILSIMFLGSTQPIMMVVSLILITLFYSFYIYMMMGSFWYSYALVMILLSGMFVIFVYMSSLIPNEEFEIYIMIFLVLFMSFFFLKKKNLLGNFNSEFVSLNLWMSYVSGILILLGVILLGIMLMVIWISCKNKSALRIM